MLLGYARTASSTVKSGRKSLFEKESAKSDNRLETVAVMLNGLCIGGMITKLF